MATLAKLYGPFFDGHAWLSVFESTHAWSIIISLILLECLLSVDNALVLATLTNELKDKKEQDEALGIGLIGSYIARFVMVGIAIYLIQFVWVKIIGALYLIYLSLSYFYHLHRPETNKKVKKTEPTVGKVALKMVIMDIVFSIDSVIAALGVSKNPIIVLIGGLIGILAMRLVAEAMVKLMVKIPELNIMAYVLILFIGVKLLISAPPFNIEIPDYVFALVLVISVVVTLLVHYLRKKRNRIKH
ncbi:TerC family protein [Xylocopilactobacillus apis]|uniref:TerC family protein n=1 Tax=Xylocopilactobacillus apis TaxID=2932183 RepID=UPI002954AE96|nr:hypothetical protein [Xylocopilactobacillus apis]